MRRREEVTLICHDCGEAFTALYDRTDRVCCKRCLARQAKARARRRKTEQERKAALENGVNAVQARARATGLTYGKYVAEGGK